MLHNLRLHIGKSLLKLAIKIAPTQRVQCSLTCSKCGQINDLAWDPSDSPHERMAKSLSGVQLPERNELFPRKDT